MGLDALVAVVIGVHKYSLLLEERLCPVWEKVGGVTGHHCIGECGVLKARCILSVV